MPTFSRENLSALFRMFDVTGKGSITLEKYFEAMKDIGVTNYNLKPRGHTENKISQEIFVDEA